MSNSPLVDYTRISPNKTSPRNHKIDTITIHCVVGQLSVETIGNIFAPKSREASSNYGIGYDGRIGMYVEEKDRSWCTSSRSNDHRAITIEVACDLTHPYAVNSKAYSALIDLLVDICQRNDIKELKWKGDKNLIGKTSKQNMTVHRWFANTSCPGEFLYSRHGKIADEVNRRLKGDVPEAKPTPKVEKLDVDGVWGKATTKRAQEVFGTPIDGKVSNQYAQYAAKNPGLSSTTFEWEAKPNGSSQLIKAIQAKVGVSQDGHIGPNTIKAMQKWLGTTADGVVSKPSQMVKAFQRWLNKQ